MIAINKVACTPVHSVNAPTQVYNARARHEVDIRETKRPRNTSDHGLQTTSRTSSTESQMARDAANSWRTV